MYKTDHTTESHVFSSAYSTFDKSFRMSISGGEGKRMFKSLLLIVAMVLKGKYG
jgi:hypothetical protein